jgi:cyclopropane-fatty-acyl-phospholipid synthase
MKTLLNDNEAVSRGTRDPRVDEWLGVARQVIGELFGAPGERTFDVQYWTGMVEHGTAGDNDSLALVINRPGALRRMFLPASELALGEAFIRGDFDIVGGVERATALRDVLGKRLRSPSRIARLVMLLRRLPTDDRPSVSSDGAKLAGRRHTPDRDASAIRYHYDVGNDFYALWLDEQRVYSCGYFTSDHDDLDQAQTDKLELICRKLRLKPGERFLDIGCGWGALVRHAVRHHDVEALGITLSPSQAEYARDRIAREGLAARCRIEVRDYRDLHGDGPFDKVASVGMIEHVGHGQLPRYFRTVFGLTRPGGLFLNHGITTLGAARDRALTDQILSWVWRSGSFIDRYVFPDSELVPLAEVTRSAESIGWEVRDVENLREHYARTLRLWLGRLESSAEAAIEAAGSETYRIWRLNMGAAADAFSGGRIAVVQMVLARADENGSASLPWTRDDIYCSPE